VLSRVEVLWTRGRWIEVKGREKKRRLSRTLRLRIEEAVALQVIFTLVPLLTHS
jgi:hypothetical protein